MASEPIEIDLILPAVSANFGYFIGFADVLLKNKSLVKIRNVHATSGGSWVAPYIVTERINDAIEWYEALFYISKKNVHNFRVFDEWFTNNFFYLTTIPIIGNWLLVFLQSFFLLIFGSATKKMSLTFFHKFNDDLAPQEKEKFKNLHIYAVNADTGTLEDFNGYSGYGWVYNDVCCAASTNNMVSRAQKINKSLYIDGFFNQMHPMKNVDTSDNVLKVILTFDIFKSNDSNLQKRSMKVNLINNIPFFSFINTLLSLFTLGRYNSGRNDILNLINTHKDRNNIRVFSTDMGWGLDQQIFIKSIENTRIAKRLRLDGEKHANKFIESLKNSQ